MLLATLGIAAMLSAREASAGAAFVAAFAIKAPAAIAAPFALVSAARMQTFSTQEWGKGCNLARGASGSRLLLGAACGGAGAGRGRLRRLRLALARRASGSPAKTSTAPATSASRSPSPASPVSTRPRSAPRPSPLFAAAFIYLLAQNLARQRLAPSSRLGLLRPPTGHRLAPPLVPDLGPAPSSSLKRSPPPAPNPSPDRRTSSPPACRSMPL